MGDIVEEKEVNKNAENEKGEHVSGFFISKRSLYLAAGGAWVSLRLLELVSCQRE